MSEPWIDFNGDGTGDEYETTTGEDGAMEYHYDADGDGQDDMVAYDDDGDGLIDQLQTDDDGDGTMDRAEFDDNGDGTMDHSEDLPDDPAADDGGDGASAPGSTLPSGLLGGGDLTNEHGDAAGDPFGVDPGGVDNPDDAAADPEGSPELSGLIDPYAAN